MTEQPDEDPVGSPTLLNAPRAPLGIRVAGAGASAARGLGVGLLDLDGEKLRRFAAGQLGNVSPAGELHDDPAFDEGLAALCHSANSDAHLTGFGRLAVASHIRRAVATRRVRATLQRTHPELLQHPIGSPIVVVGLPRSGTTFLHNMLALAPGHRPLSLWEVQRPLPVTSRSRRRRITVRQIRMLKRIAPHFDTIHYVDADSPEECTMLLDHTLVSPSFFYFAPVYSYFEWFLEQDLTTGYDGYRECLGYLQSETPGHRLVLKAPGHTLQLHQLLRVLPDAKLVLMHRDPSEVIASLCSMFFTLHSAVATVDPHDTGRALRRLLERGMSNLLASRDELPPQCAIDVDFRELIADPVAAVRRIYDHFGLPFSSTYEATLEAGAREWGEGTAGRHRYTLTDFGLEREAVREAYSPYNQRFGV